ncbi:MAG: class I SAM-dependent methyltransferase [Weeksellaceae bacterium]
MKQNEISVKDYLVSQERFQLKLDPKYRELLYTTPTPSIDKLHLYYESEDYISHDDNAKGIISKLYYAVKRYNLRFKKKLILDDKNKDNLKVLDYGCGTGELVSYLNEHGIETYGMEPNQKARKIAQKKIKNKVYPNSDFLNIEKFDVITLFHVLEHIHNLEEEVEKITKALNPNGTLYIAVPNYKSYDAHFYKEYWAAYDVPRHLWHFTEKSIHDIFSQFGMIIESIHPMWFDSFYISLISERYQGKNWGILRAPFIGLISNLTAMKNGEYSSKVYKITRKN